MGGSSYDYLVKGDVPFVRQKGNTCWAACGAMMHGWRYQWNVGLQGCVDYAGNPYIDYLKRQKTIPLKEIGSFAYAMDLKCAAMRSFSATQFFNLLATRGSPLMICILQKGEPTHHFWVVTRMYTDEDDQPTVLINDPNDSEGDKAVYFDGLYSAMARAAPGTAKQILHY